MNFIKDLLILIGILFIVFSVFVITSRNKPDRNEVATNLWKAIWVIVFFGVGGWLISVFFVKGLEWGFSLFGFWLFLMPIVIVVLMGLCGKRKDE